MKEELLCRAETISPDETSKAHTASVPAVRMILIQGHCRRDVTQRLPSNSCPACSSLFGVAVESLQGRIHDLVSEMLAAAYAELHVLLSKPEAGYADSASNTVPFLVHSPAQVRIILDCETEDG